METLENTTIYLWKKMKRKIQIISWYYYENSFALVDSLKEPQESPDHTLKSTAFCHGCPSVVPKSELSTSPGNLSEMKILWLHLKPTTWDPGGAGGGGPWSPTTWVLSGPAGDSDAHWGLSTTVLINFTEEGRTTEEKHQQGVVRVASIARKIWLS